MKRIRILIGMLVMAVLLGIYSPIETQAATSYTDPQTFFYSSDGEKHAEFTDNYIYFCTKGKTAASTSQMRFYTLGFQITATGNGSSMYIDVKRGGNYLVEVKELAYDDGFTYTLYKISYDDICKVMGNKNSTTWNNINKASAVTFQMDAIMTYKPSGSDTPACEITAESTTGKITPSTSKLWYTNNSEDLSELEDMFSVGRFEHYKGIKQTLRNNTLTVNFYAKYTDVTATGYKIDPVTSKITTLTGGVFQRTGNRFGSVALPDPVGTVNGLGLKKTGYKIVAGKEWTNNAETSFIAYNANGTATTSISSTVASQSTEVNLYANWIPITYTLKYMPNEKGTGTSTPQVLKYDTAYEAAQNMFYSDTYDFVGWNTKADGNGDWYYEGDEIKNLSSTDGDYVYLYAQWEPKIFTITVDLGEATGGTEKFYEVYKTRFTLSETATTGITKITPPTGDELPRGYHYIGAYASKYNENQQIIDANGNILITNDYYIGDKTIYSKFEPNEYTIYFDEEGGDGGTTNTTVLYDHYPSAALDAPIRKGYSFKGYYTKANGQGTCYFNEFMAPLCIYQEIKNITLYAYWVDDINPEGKLYIPDDWSNNPDGIEITGYARDYGSGLQQVKLYLEQYGGDVLVKSYTNLNGKNEIELSDITHTTEGVYVYRMEIWDMDMNLTEQCITVYKPAKYDVTEPTGYVDEDSFLSNLLDIILKVYVTDFVTGN